jgi:protein ImuA
VSIAAVHDLESIKRYLGTHARRADELSRGQVRASGLAALDQLLDGGFPKGALTIISGTSGVGRMSLAAKLLAQETRGKQPGAWIDARGTLYPPALEQAGVELARVLVVRAKDRGAYAMEQVLTSGAFGVVIGSGLEGTLTAARLRRIQTAAETSRASALLVLDPESARNVTQAAVKLRVSRRGQGIQVEVEKNRAGSLGRRAQISLSQ